MQRRLTAILAADVVGYSRLMGARRDRNARRRSTHIDGIHRRQDRRASGHVIVKLTGDGMLVEFPSVVNAVACATEIQRGMRDETPTCLTIAASNSASASTWAT